MSTLLLSERDVAGLLSWELCFAAAEQAFALGGHGAAIHRARGQLKEKGQFGALMLASASEDWGLVSKTNVHAYRDAETRRTESVLVLWNLRTARPELITASRIFNDYRTAAGFVAGARKLLCAAPRTLLIVGTGKIARPGAQAALHAFPGIERVIVRGRRPERADAFAADLRQRNPHVTVATTGGHERDGEADLVIAATTSETPVLRGEALRAGATIILGGANSPGAREADDSLIARAGRIACDSPEGAREKAGDIVMALASGALASAERLVPLPSWTAPDAGDFRVFKSIGIGEQDLMLAVALLARAREAGVGALVDLEGDAAGLPMAEVP